jgi:DNA-binding LytR/AlgR family response regulator
LYKINQLVLNSYIIIDSTNSVESHMNDFQQFVDFVCVGVYSDFESALNAIIEKKPELIFFHFTDDIPLHFILELQRYIEDLPYIIAINEEDKNAYKAIKYGVMDYILLPLTIFEIRKAFLKYGMFSKKSVQENLCIKTNSDYYFIPFEDIVYLRADNNTTDFYLKNGKVISGFKTLKFFQSQLPFYFFRIHNSYVVNINCVSRINTGKSDCYLLHNEYKLPFSRTYKDNIETIIRRIS